MKTIVPLRAGDNQIDIVISVFSIVFVASQKYCKVY